MDTKPMGSPTTYPKASDGYSKLCEKDLVVRTGTWKADGSTMYPDKNHQHQNNHMHREEKFAGGSGSDAPDSYPKKVHQTKFGSVNRQV